MRKISKYLALSLAASTLLCITACGVEGNIAKAEDAGSSAYEEAVTNEEAVPDEEAVPAEETAPDEETLNDVDSEMDNYSGEDFTENYGIAISQEVITLQFGRGTSIDVFDAEGVITWQVEDPDIVEMDAGDNYVMISGKNVGETTVTAKADNGEVSCRVRVVSAGLYLQDDRGNIGAFSSGTYALGKEHVYTAFVDGTPVPAEELTWNSMDESVASVNNGVVTMEKEGVTYISAADKSGNTAYAAIWVSETDDEYEYETKIPGSGLFLDGFAGYDEYELSHIEGEASSYYVGDVYDNGEPIDAGNLTWSVENIKGNVFTLDEETTSAEEVSIIYTGESGEGLLVAANPETGNTFRHLIVVLDLGD